MCPVMYRAGVGAVEADALFASGLQRCDEHGAGQVRQAVAEAIRAFTRSGCAGRVAQEFGDHPETAVIRMRWARAVARQTFARSTVGARPACDCWSVPRGPSAAARAADVRLTGEPVGNRRGAR